MEEMKDYKEIFDKETQEKDTVTINLYGEEFELSNRVRTYKLIGSMTFAEAGEERAKGRILKNKRKMIDGKVYSVYYELVEDVTEPISERKKTVDRILNSEILDGSKTFLDLIHEKNENYGKTNLKKTPKSSTEKVILECLGTYLISNSEDESEDEEMLSVKDDSFLNHRKVKDNADYTETATYGSLTNYNINTYNMGIVKQEEIKENTKVVRGWASSNTYKLNKLFSYSNHKRNEYGINIKRKYDRDKVDCEWFIIDTNNSFNYKGNIFKIVNVADYDRQETKRNINKLEYKCDKVLVIENKETQEIDFYTEKIECITDKVTMI